MQPSAPLSTPAFPQNAPAPDPWPDRPPLTVVREQPVRPQQGWTRGERIALITTLAGTAFRLIFVMAFHRPWKLDYSDMHSYIQGAKDFADFNKPTDGGDWYYPSGTASWIAASLIIFGKQWGLQAAAVVQALLSGIELPLVFLAARRWFGERVAVWSILLCATHYLYIGYSGLFMSENYLTIGLVASAAAFLPEKPLRCLFAGFLLGVGAWAKSQAFLLAPLWAGLLLLRKQYASALLVVAGVSAVVVPVSIVCSLKAMHPTFISNNGGQTFALGQCPIKAIKWVDPIGHGEVGFGVPNLYQRIARGEIEASWQDATYNETFFNSKFYMHEGFECIRKYPKHAIRMFFLHFIDTFAGPPWSNVVPWPDSHIEEPIPGTNIRIPYGPFSGGSNLFVAYLVAPLAFWTFWRKRRDWGMWFLFAAPIASLLASAVLFHGDPRFRAPYDFYFFMAASVGFLPLYDKWMARWFGRTPPLEPRPVPKATTPLPAIEPVAAQFYVEP